MRALRYILPKSKFTPKRFAADTTLQFRIAPQKMLKPTPPYEHRAISPVRSKKICRPMFLAWSFAVALPVMLTSAALISVLRRIPESMGAQAVTAAQRIAFWAMTRFSDKKITSAAIMFSDELVPWPTDAAISEAVLTLGAIGIRTIGCCEGHPGYLAHVVLAPGFLVPEAVIAWLKRARVAYEISEHCDAVVLSAAQGTRSDVFCRELTSWARAVRQEADKDAPSS